jgi:hypothetical protein
VKSLVAQSVSTLLVLVGLSVVWELVELLYTVWTRAARHRLTSMTAYRFLGNLWKGICLYECSVVASQRRERVSSYSQLTRIVTNSPSSFHLSPLCSFLYKQQKRGGKAVPP